MRIDLRSRFGSGRDTSRGVWGGMAGWSRRQRKHVGAEDHSGPPGRGLRQAENGRRQEGPRRRNCDQRGRDRDSWWGREVKSGAKEGEVEERGFLTEGE